MRRPIVSITIAFVLGIAFAYLLQNEFGIIEISTTLVVVVLLCKSLNKKYSFRLGFLYFLFFVFLLGFFLFQEQEDVLQTQAEKLCKQNEIIGIILSVEKKDVDYARFEVKTSEGRVLVSLYEEIDLTNVYEGREAKFEGKIEIPKGRTNPRCFDYREYLKTKKICATMSVNAGNFEVREVKRPITNTLASVRIHFLEKVTEYAGAEFSGLLAGILFGEKTGIDEELYEQFQKVGTAHILAVSGLHIGLVYGVSEKLFGRRRGAGGGCLKALVVLLYAAMAGFSASVGRAAAMIVLGIAARALSLRYDMLSAACSVALCGLALNPHMLFGSGFQLSYLAIISISIVGNRLRARYEGFLVPSLSVQIGLAPYLAYSFNTFSLISILANIPILFLAGIIVPVGLLALVLSIFPEMALTEILFQAATAFLSQACEALVWCNGLAFAEGRTFIYCKSPLIFQLALYYAILFFASSETAFLMFSRKEFKRIALILLLILVLVSLIALMTSTPFDEAQMIFVDVGQGDCLHIRTEDGKNILIDGGGSATYDVGKKTLLPYLLKNGVEKIDLALITHLHKDHYDGIRSLAEFIEIEKIGLYEGYRYSDEKINDLMPKYIGEYMYLHAGQNIKVSEKVTLEILYPLVVSEEEYKKKAKSNTDENKMSLIVKVNYDGLKVLMTADIDSEGEHELIKTTLPTHTLASNILKVPHHGSKYSSSEDFIKAVNPQIAMIQVGKNNFGHPSETVIEKYKKSGIIIYRNDENGAVGIYEIKSSKGKICKMLD